MLLLLGLDSQSIFEVNKGEFIFSDTYLDIFLSVLVFFHKHSRMTGMQGKGIQLSPHYHFHPLLRHLTGRLLQRAHLCTQLAAGPFASERKSLTTKLRARRPFMRLAIGHYPLCENYAKLNFNVKHLEMGLNRGWLNFWCPFFPKSALFGQYRMLSQFFGLDPDSPAVS